MLGGLIGTKMDEHARAMNARWEALVASARLSLQPRTLELAGACGK